MLLEVGVTHVCVCWLLLARLLRSATALRSRSRCPNGCYNDYGCQQTFPAVLR